MSDFNISLELTNGTNRPSLNLMSKSTPLKPSTLSSNGSCHQPGSSSGLQDIPSPPVPSKSNIVANKTSNLSHVPCKFFKQGTCTAGTNCTFSHNLTPNSESSVCKYFIKGNCKFGTKCALLHTMSPYGENRKIMNSWSSANGGMSLLQKQQLQQQQQQQQHYQSIHALSDTTTSYTDFARPATGSGFSQLTAAIQQQHHYPGLSTSIPTNSSNPHYQYRPQSSSTSIKHPGISSLRTTPSVWDPSSLTTSINNGNNSNNSSSNSTSNSLMEPNGHLQRIPEADHFEHSFDTSRQQQYNHMDAYRSRTLSKSYDPWTRHSSRFFQSPVDSVGSPLTSMQAQQHPPSLYGSFDRSDALLGGAHVGSGNSNTDLSDIWAYPKASSSGFNDVGRSSQQQHLFGTSANAINIPGMNLSTPIGQSSTAEDADFALHYRRRQQLYQQYHRQEHQQHQQQSFSSHSNTPEPSSFMPPFTEDMYRQQQQRPPTTPGTMHDENDVPFFMDDTEEDGNSPEHRQDPQNRSLGFPSFTSLVRPTY